MLTAAINSGQIDNGCFVYVIAAGSRIILSAHYGNAEFMSVWISGGDKARL